MKSSLSLPLKLLFLILATLSQFFFTNSASAQGRGLGYIENLSQEREDVEIELEKQETILKQLELAETSAGKIFLSYDGFKKVPNSKSFAYIGKCVPANGTGKYESVSCREKLLTKMCETELLLETVDDTINFCQQYFDLATSNQSQYSQESQMTRSKQMCLVLPFHVERYQYLDKDSLEKALLACQKALLSRSYYSTTREARFILLNLKEIYFVLKDYSGAKKFFTNILNIAKKNDKQNNSESSEQDISWYAINMIYPALNFLGDIYFETEDFDKAMNLYLEADSIYTKGTNYQASNSFFKLNKFLTDEMMVGGYLSSSSITRAYSFIGSRSRLAFIMAMKGQTNNAKKLLSESIRDLEKVSHGQVDKADSIALQEMGTPLYTTQQLLLINDKKYEKALEFADRSRSLSYLFSLKGISKDIPDVLSFKEMQAFAKEQKTTLVLYSIPDLPIYDYDKFQAREDKVLIWVIQPNGKLDFREVDVSSALSQSNSKSEFSNTNSTSSIYGAIALVVSIGAFVILFPNHRRIGVAALIGISAGLVMTNVFNSSAKLELKDQETTQQTVTLSNLTKDTLLAIKNRDSNQTSLLKKLYKVLIEPIQNTLPTNPDEHIVFIPYRGLHRVPFASLISSDNKYLIDQHTIRIAPSIQALKFITERAASAERVGNDYLIVGNPEMSKLSLGSLGVTKVPGQLPSAEVEAREIAKLYGTTPLIGKDASIERVKNKLFNSRILHFATHGFLNIGDSRAGLVFASESQRENSGVLATREFYGRRFLAEMAVLSACNTGLGAETVEGNLGLTRPFLIAGVPTVVSSLWSVPDQSTTELMIDFYQNLKNTSDRAKALRQAMLNTKGKHPDPVDWAGFILTGLGESPRVSTTSVKQVVGYMSCAFKYARGGDAGNNSRDIVSADLKSTPNGFTLAFTEASGSKHKLDLDQNLVVVSAGSFDEERNIWGPWNLVSYDKTPIQIEPDGSFDASMSVSTRYYCVIKGKVEFIGDAADKLARSKR
ncbi:MAG: CHAT domain-containing protein [Okeania sp. SIO3I5]|uniref:CHAT domain-containing protein n=1 Tax=Okeania sp. SIO3I5 TaxID=2607805 RepID=UPI0013BD112D|nr:CHAT domain-containing protein [Okeania sp. SIO3I5]NEQ38564.1 CHAT domain-containing protein [Okeania sp. SIO3I5]